MTQTSRPYTVVVGVDYSEASERAINTALDLAAERPASEVHVLHVLPPPQAFVTPETFSVWDGSVVNVAEAAEKLKAYVEAAVAKRGAQKPGPGRVVAHVLVDRPAEQLAQLASDVEADIVVVGTHGRRGVARVILGSVAETTIRLAPCPVLVVRPRSVPPSQPSIEPPCPRCVETRRATDGRDFWCAQHSERHGRRHTYFQSDRVSSDGNLPLVMRR